MITTLENETAQSDNNNNNNEIPAINIPPQFSVYSKEAESVSKQENTNTYHTVEAEDPLSQTSTNNPNPTTAFPNQSSTFDLPTESFTTVELLSGDQTKSSSTTPRQILSPEQAPILTRTNSTESTSTESSSTPEGVSLHPQSIEETPSASSPVLENLPRILQESSGPPPSETGSQSCLDEDTRIPLSEASLTPPPPLTHSSSFESAIEFWKRRSLLSTADSIQTPQLSPYAESDVSLPISILPKCNSPIPPPLHDFNY